MSTHKRFNAVMRRLKQQDSFIGAYLRYMDAQETAVEYDFFSACWLVGNAVGRRVKVARPRAPVWLNWYIVLVAESGVTRKSSAVRAATDVLRAMRAEIHEDSTHQFDVMTSKATPEAVMKSLVDAYAKRANAHLALSVSEMVTFFGKDTYTSSMPSLLTDLYDCPSSMQSAGTIGRGSYHARNVFLTLITASTPAWLIRSINPNIIEGGFTSRTMFVHAETPKRRVAWPSDESATEHDRHFREVVERLLRIYSLSVTETDITISPGALKRFSDWYNKRGTSYEPYRASFESREDAHVLRLAATLCISEGTWRIDVDHVRDAITIISYIKESSAEFFVSGERASQFALAFDKLRTMFIEEGLQGCTLTQLNRKTSHICGADVLNQMLDVMHEMQLVQKFQHTQLKRGRPVMLYRGTNKLLRKGIADQVFQGMMPGG